MEKQKVVAWSVLVVVVLLTIGGGIYYWQKNQTEVSSKTSDTTKTYRNEKYGFEIKCPSKDYTVFEESGTDFLLALNIARVDGSSMLEINIIKNENKNNNIDSLRNEIKKWYGETSWPFKFPVSKTNTNIQEFSIDGHIAIRSDYLETGEGFTSWPASQIFILDPQYIYKIDYAGGPKEEGEEIFSTFKFIK